MEISVADQRILVFAPQLTRDEAEAKSWARKTDPFGAIGKLTGFLSKPKDGDFERTYGEFRYQPFWHVIANAKYVYDRTATYQAAVSGREVRSAEYGGETYDSQNGHIHFRVLEHCVQEESDEVFIDGISGKPVVSPDRYMAISPTHVTGQVADVLGKDAILVPPQTRVSAIMRDSLSKMIKGIQADRILEEAVEVKCVDLFYRPVYAFKYRWVPKDKEGICEVDGITGEVSTGNKTFQEYMGKVLDTNFLFDLGADAAGMLIPGGSIAVKVAKKYIDSRKTK